MSSSRHQQPPPRAQRPALETLRLACFASPLDGLISLTLISALLAAAWQLLRWALVQAQWSVIAANSTLLALGRYPEPQRWRLWLLLWLLSTAAGLSWGLLRRQSWPRNDLLAAAGLSGLTLWAPAAVALPLAAQAHWWGLTAWLLLLRSAAGAMAARMPTPVLQRWPLLWPVVYVSGMALIAGGFGLMRVPSPLWGGLLLTLIEACFAMLLCLPLGLALALGRRSNLPLLRLGSVAYIEFIRGAPLITLLFLGQNILGFLLPGGLSPDRIWRAAWVLTVFASAYVAEALRAGLAAIPRGQVEAARSLGLNTPQTLSHVVLPQAIKVALPALVGQFISLLQDTTLLSLIGLMELLGTARTVLANPEFLGRNAEVYVVLAMLFWCCCASLGLGSRALESRLNRQRSTAV
ncbi:MAG: amino acid ABC transporter permease [Prochlorococcaceae cyanobacterium]